MPLEVVLSGAGVSTTELDAGAAQVGLSVGYFLDEMFSLSVRQNLLYGDAGVGTSEAWDGVTRVAADLHVPLGKFVPYLGANAGYVYGDSFTESFMAGPETGIKYFLKDDAFVQFGVEWQFFFDKGDSLTTAFDDGQLLYLLGFGLRF
jgi:hypothetical protein